MCFCGFHPWYSHLFPLTPKYVYQVANRCLLCIKVTVVTVVQVYSYIILSSFQQSGCYLFECFIVLYLSTLFTCLSFPLHYSAVLGCWPVFLPLCLLLNMSFQRDDSKDQIFFGSEHIMFAPENGFHVFFAVVLLKSFGRLFP